jgi:uncharacterized phosphosugar-binding protein
MDIDDSDYQMLVADAAKARRRRVFLLIASAIRNPSPGEVAHIAAAEAAAALANRALIAWHPDDAVKAMPS